MKRFVSSIVCISAAIVPSIALAGHSNLLVPPSETFLLGGEQRGALVVSGTNLGPTTVTILARTGEKDTAIATVAPGGTFAHDFAVGEIALVANGSTKDTARLSVDFTGSPSSLSMRYVKPPR